MKKLLALMLLILGLSTAALAAPMDIQTILDDGTTSANADVAAKTNRSITIWSIDAYSDKPGSMVKVYVGAEAGVTTSYTQVMQYDCGDTTVMLNEGGDKPLINLGTEYKGYQMRVDVDGTSKSYIKLNYSF